MKILVKRIAKKATYTIGKLYINGEFFCNTIEDKDRGLRSDMSLEEIKKIKINYLDFFYILLCQIKVLILLYFHLNVP